MNDKKVVLITGGAMGQGRGHAYKYAKNNFDVVLADMLEPENEHFQETIKECQNQGAKVLAMRCDITNNEDMEKLFSKAWETFGRLDVVIANAGVINFGYTWELTDEQVEKVININLIGTWRTDKYAAKYMLKQGFGRIAFGFIYDKLKGWNSLLLVLVINGISMLMLTIADSYIYFILCIALVGFSFGGAASCLCTNG